MLFSLVAGRNVEGSAFTCLSLFAPRGLLLTPRGLLLLLTPRGLLLLLGPLLLSTSLPPPVVLPVLCFPFWVDRGRSGSQDDIRNARTERTQDPERAQRLAGPSWRLVGPVG